MSTVSCHKKSQREYKPRSPERTVLFQLIKKHFNTWYNNSKNPVPGYVSKEFNSFLGCGILAKGFACAHCEGCNKDFLIAFSCKGRGICPSCNTRAMVETAAHLIESVIPRVPVRQFVISFPMRIRHYLQTHAILQACLHIVVDEIRKKFIALSPDVPKATIGAISFIQHFGNSLNMHPHFHILCADGIFNAEGEEYQFFEAAITQDDVADIQDAIQMRVLKLFGRRGWFDKEAIEKMQQYENSGFSLDAKVRIEAWDRDGLERLIRYCARPSFASENLRLHGRSIIYRFPKPSRTGQTFIQLEPLEFLTRIAAFIPYPRRHRRHYHGVFASTSPLRKKVAANAKNLASQTMPDMREAVEKVEKVSSNWAKLIARIYEVNPLTCTGCGKNIRIISFVTHREAIWRILKGIGLEAVVPEFDPAYDITERDICQLVPGTKDGFPEMDEPLHCDVGPDPPHIEDYCDPPHWQD
jgi:hypothetical protein